MPPPRARQKRWLITYEKNSRNWVLIYAAPRVKKKGSGCWWIWATSLSTSCCRPPAPTTTWSNSGAPPKAAVSTSSPTPLASETAHYLSRPQNARLGGTGLCRISETHAARNDGRDCRNQTGQTCIRQKCRTGAGCLLYTSPSPRDG